MHIGVDYYPEHWSRERWETDARLMAEAGFDIVRLAEFAWVNLEPREGKYDFAWLDEAVATLERHGLSVILCTQTATMPAWVARKYPETLLMQRDGTRITWGVRKNNCFTSGAYRLLSERMTRAIAEHYQDAPNVVGWQTDNEFGSNPFCYCDTCRQAFRDWLRAKYGSLDVLNRAWGTHFWGHTLGDWDEIVVPDQPRAHNPSACLDWQRFYSWLNVRFQADQVRILRQVCPNHFVTHNLMGLFQELDYYALAEDLDHVSWDSYAVWGKLAVPYRASEGGDLMRSLKRRNYWVMETNAGPSGWGAYGRNPRPGEMRKLAFQQVAHGADGYLWFRWRTCTAGREQYWHGLLGHDGRALRRYREAAETTADLRKVAKELRGTTVKAPVAIIYDYDSLWALRLQPGYAGNTYHGAMDRVYRALFRAGVNVDYCQVGDNLGQYKAVFAPNLYVLPDGKAEDLITYVERGGVFYTDSRFGVKDETGLCHERTLPGLLSNVLGITIEEYEALSHEWHGDDSTFTYGVTGKGPLAGTYTATLTAEWARAETAESLVSYDAWHLASFCAATRNQFGKGYGYFVGTVIEQEQFYDLLVQDILDRADIVPPVKPPAGVEVSVREGKDKQLLFVVNHTEEPQVVHVPPGALELLTDTETGGVLTLGRFGVAVIRLC